MPSPGSLLAVAALLAAAAPAPGAPVRRPIQVRTLWGTPPAERGVGLGLFSADPTFRYRALVDEVAATGATHISVVWVWWQEDLRATRISNVPGWSATDEQVQDTLRYARDKGLHVTAFPIVRLKKSSRDEWRGRIAPEREDDWWQSYTDFILHAAEVAKASGAERLCVGSELLSREAMRGRWVEVIDRVRMAAPELELLYSANWDHFEAVSFWDKVDVVGMTAYWELTRDPEASVTDLMLSWQSIRPQVEDFARRLGRSIIFTEVGYPSIDGGAAWPWDETRTAPLDQEEQRRAYEAFVRAWSGASALTGVYFWNWFGFGGPKDGNYTPRDKPAADVLRAWYRQEGER